MEGWKRIFNEPILLGGVVRAVIYMLMAFGVGISTEQLAAVMTVVETILLLVTRAYVTPNHLAEARVAQGGSPTTPLNK